MTVVARSTDRGRTFRTAVVDTNFDFPVNEEVERSWEILDPVIDLWNAQPEGPDPYPAGSWGPESADRMLARTGRKWRRP